MGDTQRIPNLLVKGFFLWTLWHYGLGGYETAVMLLTLYQPLSWLLLGGVVCLLLYQSDYRTDVPLFIAGWLLGYWGEWWGTTRGVWWYWNGAAPPDYLPPLWGLGLLTVYRLSQLLLRWFPKELPRGLRWVMGSCFVLLPLILLGRSWSLLGALGWRGWLDGHFFAGLIVAAALIVHGFDLRRDFLIYLSGTLLGGLYEYLGTTLGEWTYISGENPPLWIAPLWGLASVAMVSLSFVIGNFLRKGWGRIRAYAHRFRADALL